jgi:prepilin-type N-terminal cleavage/methylation domain-containing protein
MSRVQRTARRGFTLIELLVVIAIIAILAAILLPVLSRAKLKAYEAQCLSNQHQIMIGMFAYAADHADQILPYNNDVNYAAAMMQGSAEYDLALTQGMLRTNNALFSYAANVGVYHCPGDKRFLSEPRYSTHGWAFLSYAKTENVAGDPCSDYYAIRSSYQKFAAVRNPASTFAFTESRGLFGCSSEPWILLWDSAFGFNSGPTLCDAVPGVDHGPGTVFSYADGHTVTHKWTASIQSSAREMYYHPFVIPRNSLDLYFLSENYQFPGWRMPTF